MSQFNRYILFLVLINTIFLVVLGVYVFQYSQANEVRVVNDQELFERFKMTEDMKRIGLQEIQKRQQALDTIHKQLQQEDIAKENKEVLMQRLISGRQELDAFNQRFSIEETQKIWSRISDYSKEFALKKGYKVVLGKSNPQQVLFSEESLDVTKEFLFYINSRYEGN